MSNKRKIKRPTPSQIDPWDWASRVLASPELSQEQQQVAFAVASITAAKGECGSNDLEDHYGFDRGSLRNSLDREDVFLLANPAA